MEICDKCKYNFDKDGAEGLCVPCFNKEGYCYNYVKEGERKWHAIIHLPASIMEKKQQVEKES